MPHFTQDQQPVSVGDAVVRAQAQLTEIKQFLTDLHETSKKQPPAPLPGFAATGASPDPFEPSTD